jgi:hypothetical protein
MKPSGTIYKPNLTSSTSTKGVKPFPPKPKQVTTESTQENDKNKLL